MTAQNGLHNLPAALRPAVAAHPGHVLVRADLGQIEPRVLAVVSGDRAFAAATRADDLYAPVAATLGVERPVAKVAVLAAMYGQRSGAAGEALKGLERAYPVAMALLDRAYAAGVRRQDVRTFGGRIIPMGSPLGVSPPGAEPARARRRSRRRTRPAAGSPATRSSRGLRPSCSRPGRRPCGPRRATSARRSCCASTTSCSLHVPEEHAEEAKARLERALSDSARRWTGSTEVRFVADASIIRRWSDAKE